MTFRHNWRDLRASSEMRGALSLGLVLGLAYSLVGPFMSLFGTSEVGLSAFQFGLFMTATSLSAVVVSSWVARASDVRYSRRTTLLLSGCTGALGYVGYAFVRDGVWLVLIGSTALAVSAGSFSQLFAYSRDVIQRDERLRERAPLYMNVVRLSFAFAWTVGPMLSAWLMTRMSFVGTFLAAAALYALYTLLVFLLVPSRPPSAAERASATAVPLGRALSHPVVLTYFCAFALYHACSVMGMMNLPLYLTRTLAGDATDVGIAYSVAPVFELPFMVSVGFIALRVDHARIIRISLFVAALYYAGLTLAEQTTNVFLLQILSAFIVSVMSGLAITFFQDFLPGQPGTATNLYSNSARVGSLLGYLCFGAVAEKYGHRAVFLACAVACSLSFAALLLLGSRRIAFGAETRTVS